MKKIIGQVIKGSGRGRIIGFPTVNIELRDKLRSGVYGGIIEIDNKKYKAGVFIGRDGKILEAHIIGFSGNLYREEIEVEIGKKIREVMKFNSNKELRQQIEKDINLIISGFLPAQE